MHAPTAPKNTARLQHHQHPGARPATRQGAQQQTGAQEPLGEIDITSFDPAELEPAPERTDADIRLMRALDIVLIVATILLIISVLNAKFGN